MSWIFAFWRPAYFARQFLEQNQDKKVTQGNAQAHHLLWPGQLADTERLTCEGKHELLNDQDRDDDHPEFVLDKYLFVRSFIINKFEFSHLVPITYQG